MTSNPLIGIGLRHPHYGEVLQGPLPIDWFEVHSENFFFQGGPALDLLLKVRERYPVSLHGVGLSLGSAQISSNHLRRLRELIDKVEPFLVSEHISWNSIGSHHLPDLFPIPYNDESLQIICQNIDQTQTFLGREILIENPSSYIEYHASTHTEIDFLITLCQTTGAKLLLDINNVFVACSNHHWDTKAYIEKIPPSIVREIHLAGHQIKSLSQNQILRIDTHDKPVCQEVWDLYQLAVKRFGQVPTLLEWDNHLPPLAELIQEAHKAKQYIYDVT